MTERNNESQALTQFKAHLNSSTFYFNEERFPENESNEDARVKCTTFENGEWLSGAFARVVFLQTDFHSADVVPDNVGRFQFLNLSLAPTGSAWF